MSAVPRAARDVPVGESWAFTDHRSLAEADAQVRALPIELVYPDPDQPRTVFDPAGTGADAELAASIRENGLQQPITVRPDEEGRFRIVFGERRYRAHLHNRANTILAAVRPMQDLDVFVVQIVENLQRKDLTALEEARAYQRLVDKMGGDVEAAAKRLGMSQPWRITERTCLLRLAPEYRELVASGNIGNSQAYEMAQLSPIGQHKLFRAVKAGLCPTYKALRAVAVALREADAQGSMFGAAMAQPAATEADLRHARSLERKIERACAVLAEGFHDNEIVAVARIDPGKAANCADKIALMVKSLGQIERALRSEIAVKVDLCAA